MYLYKRGNVWWAKYQVDGVVHQISTKARKRSEAEAFVRAIDTARRSPTLDDAIAVLKVIYRKEDPKATPISETWAAYERVARAVGKLAVSEKTIKDRRNHTNAFVAWVQEKAATVRHVEDVTGAVAAMYAEHLAQGGAKTKTRKNTLLDLSAVWRMLEKTSERVRDPWRFLAPRDTDGQRLKEFTRTQERAVFEAAERIGKDWYAVCMVARHTGLRYGDVANLKWEQIHFDGRDPYIELPPNKTKAHGIVVTLPLIAESRAVLRAHPKTDEVYVFPVHHALYGDTSGAAQRALSFREVLNAAGITEAGYTFHSFRHTAASRLAEAGADIETRKRILGHTADETARRYDHFDHLDEERIAMEAAAAEPTKKPARRQPQRAAIRAGTIVQSRGSIALR